MNLARNVMNSAENRNDYSAFPAFRNFSARVLGNTKECFANLRQSSIPEILPFHIEADRYWSARSWDQTQIPRPFSHNYIAIGAPFEVPDPSGDGVIAKHQVALQQELSRLAKRAAQLVGADTW